MATVKALASQSNDLKSVPSNFAYATVTHYEPTSSEPQSSIPIIDYSLLTSGTPDQRSKIVQELGKACEEWGFFLLVNHGIPETLIEKVFDASNEFFNLSDEEKKAFNGKGLLDPIKCGTSFDGAENGKVLLWRDYLKVIAHPQFHFPNKPQGFSELALEYSTRTRAVARELLHGVSESLGLEESLMEKELNLDSGFQLFAVNYYPPCPQPDVAIGIPHHTDHGLLTLLYQNKVAGLEILHDGKWFKIDAALPNAFLVNTGDQLEIFTNGKYKSVMHRAVLNDKVTRMSLVTPNGPSLETVVSPCAEFVDAENRPPAYKALSYKEFMELLLNTAIDGILPLERIRIPAQ